MRARRRRFRPPSPDSYGPENLLRISRRSSISIGGVTEQVLWAERELGKNYISIVSDRIEEQRALEPTTKSGDLLKNGFLAFMAAVLNSLRPRGIFATDNRPVSIARFPDRQNGPVKNFAAREAAATRHPDPCIRRPSQASEPMELRSKRPCTSDRDGTTELRPRTSDS
jgi:hypothetical protein